VASQPDVRTGRFDQRSRKLTTDAKLDHVNLLAAEALQDRAKELFVSVF
jgi:hypothetical protein